MESASVLCDTIGLLLGHVVVRGGVIDMFNLLDGIFHFRIVLRFLVQERGEVLFR